MDTTHKDHKAILEAMMDDYRTAIAAATDLRDAISVRERMRDYRRNHSRIIKTYGVIWQDIRASDLMLKAVLTQINNQSKNPRASDIKRRQMIQQWAEGKIMRPTQDDAHTGA